MEVKKNEEGTPADCAAWRKPGGKTNNLSGGSIGGSKQKPPRSRVVLAAGVLGLPRPAWHLPAYSRRSFAAAALSSSQSVSPSSR